MSDLITALRAGPVLADGGIGSYIFELTGRLSEGRFAYEALNLENPELIKGIHLAYLQAGARALTTNTFAASPPALAHVSLAGSYAEINRAGVRLAREAIRQFAGDGQADGYFVLGSIGPIAEAPNPEMLEKAYRQQAVALVSAETSELDHSLRRHGVDAFLLETFTSLEQAVPALQACRDASPGTPVIFHIATERRTDGWSEDPVEVVRTAVEYGAKVIGANCCAPWDARGFIEKARSAPEVASGQVLLSAMPNAGGFERIGQRFLSRVNPEYMGTLARTLAGEGARLIGGCCEVHPPHIAEMRNYLLPVRAGSAVAVATAASQRAPAGPAEKSGNGRFSRKLFAGEFAVSVEVLPPRGTGPRSIREKIEFVRELAASGQADAIDITDGSRGIPLVPPGDFAALVREATGWGKKQGLEGTGEGPRVAYGSELDRRPLRGHPVGRNDEALEIIPHFTSRDLNAMGIQSRLMGYYVRDIHNVLFITGDPPKMSPTYPRSTAVFDLDSVSLVRYTQGYLNSRLDFGGVPLGRHADPRTHFTIGVGIEPEALDWSRESEKLKRKLDAGADYVFTQPAYRPEALDRLEQFRTKTRVFLGVMLLSSVEHAKRFAEVPGVHVPQAIFDRIGRFSERNDQASAGIELAIEQVRAARAGGWAGAYLMSPAGHEPVIEVLRSSVG